MLYLIFMLIVGSTGGEITALTFDGCDAEDDDECEAAKGQLISKCHFGVIVWNKKTTKLFPGFLP